MKKTTSEPKPKTAGRPAGGGALSKRLIAEAALAHIDEYGLGAFSMREIAARLGVYPATVHWHVSTREALLAEVAAMVMADVTPPPGKQALAGMDRATVPPLPRRGAPPPERGAVAGRATGVQRQPAHRAGGRRARGPGRGRIRGTTAAGGLQLRDRGHARLCDDGVFPLPSDNTQAWAEELRERVHTIRPLDHPVLTRNLPLLANQAFIVRWDNGSTVPLDSSFERHIQIVIDGLEAFARRLVQ